MEFYIPSLFIVLIAAIFLVLVLPQLSQLVLTTVCTLLLVWGLVNHYTLFSSEYHNMNWTNTAVAAGPYIMLFTVIGLSIGYIILLFTRKGGSRAAAPMNVNMSIPPPESATNYVTQGIGNSLVSSGMANVDESALSKKI
jgi:hypothetical protein